MKVLLVTSTSPTFGNSGGALRTRGWMRAAATSAELGIVSCARDGVDERGMQELSRRLGFVRSVPIRRTAWRRGRDLVRSLLRQVPYKISAELEQRMQVAVADAIATWRPDIVQAEGITATPYLDLARAAGIPTVYSAHNVESRVVSAERDAWVFGASRITEWMRRLEEQAARRAAAVVAVTEIETEWFRRVAAEVRCIPNAVELEGYDFEPPPARQGSAVVFVGHLAYPPNVEAARRLVHGVLPSVRRRHAAVQCIVAGRAPGHAVRNLVQEGTCVVADPEDMSDTWRRAAVLVCPLRSGAGSRLKLLEAAAYGVPIVCTAVAAEGLSLRAGRDYLMSESDDGLAEQTVTVLNDPDRARELALRARATVAAAHDWRLFRRPIGDLYASLVGHDR